MTAADALEGLSGLVRGLVREIPDFPRPGVSFKDLTPVLADGAALRAVVDGILAVATADARDGTDAAGRPDGIDVVAGIEARGFLLAAPLAYAAGCGVVPIRKVGKLPARTIATSYRLEYGEATVEVHADAFTPGARVLVVDDVLATGGTLNAALDVIGKAGATPCSAAVIMELPALGGRARVREHAPDLPLHAITAG